jgi:DtxR family Mn-dependent transcriptional regulator
MLKKLNRAGLVCHRQRKGVRLTEKGKRSALDVLRRHRLIELFLAEVLEMPWESVHQEAERLEHVVSDEVLRRIDRLLGFPERDPHGSPIPSSKGKFVATKATRLDKMQAGQRGVISEVEDDEPVMLRHLKKIGLVPGVEITLIEVLAVDGTRVLECKRRRRMISPKVASAVWITDHE